MRLHVRELALAALLAGAPGLAVAADDWQAQVGEALGKTGATAPGGIYRVGLPRTDLKVTLDGVELKPGFALGSWLAFEKMGDQGMVMGDLVLTDGRGQPGHDKARRGRHRGDGIAQSPAAQPALHDVHACAGEWRSGEARSGAPHGARRKQDTALCRCRRTPTPPPPIDLDTAAIDQTLGAKGTNNGGVYQFSIPRAEPIKDGGMDVPPPMGSANAINFQPTGGGKAAITGDFVLIAKEVNPVLKALREHGIEVTAIHNHMLDDQPHLYFMHFWANDDAKKLAEGLKAALAQINIAKS